MLDFVNSIGKEVLVALVVSLITATLGFVYKWLTGQPNEKSSVSVRPIQHQDYSARAFWALVLGVGSYFMWLIPPLPILIPFALVVSLWLGLTSRWHTSGKVAATASCLHLILMGCGLVFLVVTMVTSNSNSSNVGGLLICYDQYRGMYYYC